MCSLFSSIYFCAIIKGNVRHKNSSLETASRCCDRRYSRIRSLPGLHRGLGVRSSCSHLRLRRSRAPNRHARLAGNRAGDVVFFCGFIAEFGKSFAAGAVWITPWAQEILSAHSVCVVRELVSCHHSHSSSRHGAGCCQFIGIVVIFFLESPSRTCTCYCAGRVISRTGLYSRRDAASIRSCPRDHRCRSHERTVTAVGVWVGCARGYGSGGGCGEEEGKEGVRGRRGN